MRENKFQVKLAHFGHVIEPDPSEYEAVLNFTAS
jgi:hypothetical protein